MYTMLPHEAAGHAILLAERCESGERGLVEQQRAFAQFFQKAVQSIGGHDGTIIVAEPQSDKPGVMRGI